MKTWRVTSDDTQAGLRKWADGLMEAFVQLEPLPTVEDGFFGQIQQVSTPDVDVSLVTSNGHEVRRSRRHIRHRAAETKFVNILSRGRSQVTQGHVFEAAPMDISIVDTREPYSIRQVAPFELVSIAVPADWIDRQAGVYHPLSRTSSGRELSGLFWSLAKLLLTRDATRADVAEPLAQQLRHCLTLLHRIETAGHAPRANVDLLQSYIRRHFDQPDLRAQRIAAHFGLSVRRVHQLFEPTGQSVTEFINEARLERAMDLLVANTGRAAAISEIAWQVGYSDPSYFSRRFKQRFGCAPRDYREERPPDPIAHLS